MLEKEVQPQETANTAVETPPPPQETATEVQGKALPPIETVNTNLLPTDYSTTEPDYSNVKPTKLKSFPTTKTEKPLSDWAKRFVITKNLPGKRGAMVKAVIEAGVKEGYWKDGSHFMDKVLDFAINSQAANKALGITKGFQFGIPDNVPTAIFGNGYYWQFDKLKTHEAI